MKVVRPFIKSLNAFCTAISNLLFKLDVALSSMKILGLCNNAHSIVIL